MIGMALKEMRKSEGLTQGQLAIELNLSKSMVCEIENGNRKLNPDIASHSLKKIDNPNYALDVLHLFSDGFTAPRLNGKSVEYHRLALEEFAMREMEEAVQILKDVSLVKPPQESDLEELERIEDVVGELEDAALAIRNLQAILATEYQLPLKELKKNRSKIHKERGWIK